MGQLGAQTRAQGGEENATCRVTPFPFPENWKNKNPTKHFQIFEIFLTVHTTCCVYAIIMPSYFYTFTLKVLDIFIGHIVAWRQKHHLCKMWGSSENKYIDATDTKLQTMREGILLDVCIFFSSYPWGSSLRVWC